MFYDRSLCENNLDAVKFWEKNSCEETVFLYIFTIIAINFLITHKLIIMTEAIIAGISTIITAIVTVLITDYLNKKREKDNAELIKKITSENNSLHQELQQAIQKSPKNFEIIKDVDDVLHRKILPLLRNESTKRKKIVVKNLGLDLHSVMPWMENKIIHSEEFDNIYIEINSLIINPDSHYIKEYIDGHSNIKSGIVTSSIDIGNSLHNHNDIDRFCLKIRQYDLPPIFHGFILNDEHLFLGFTEIHSNKIIGGTKPYLYLWRNENKESELNSHFFKFYTDWFDYYWKISKEVVNVTK